MEIKFSTAEGIELKGTVIAEWSVGEDYYYKVKAYNGKQYVVMESFIISKEVIDDKE